MTKDTNPYRILFKLPSRGRAIQYVKCLENIVSNIENETDYLILCTLDKDDDDSYGYSRHDVDRAKLVTYWGVSKNKVDAVNRDIDKIPYEWDIVIAMSDDMEWQVDGFDNIIRDTFKQLFPDLDGFLHFNDGYVGDRLCTMNIMGRKYYNRTHYIYHPDYIGLWCDNESTEVAKKLGKYVYDPRVIFKHQHPANTTTVQMDDSYRKYLKFNDQDNLTYRRRKYELNFDLE